MRRSGRQLALALCLAFWLAASARAQEPADPQPYLHDRGPGLPTSLFGTYIRKGELLIYPFFEYYRDADYEYSPAELGFGLEEDFRGRYRASEGLLFVGYGITENLAIEIEAAVISATLETSPDDPTGIPDRIEESGLGDIEGQLRWRFSKETARRPELFGYFEAVVPNESDTGLIGTSDWEWKLGGGLSKGLSWGTWTARLAVEYDAADFELSMGEFAVEYLKRLSPSWRLFLAVEGTQDEIELITEVQWHIASTVVVKLGNAFGITSKATDWAPEVGVLFSFPIGTR